MFSKIAIVALFAGLVAGQAKPVGNPSGNPITRPLNEIVPACKAFTITWQPTTPNSVSLLLLKGPATNVVPLGAPLFVGLPNSGSFVWTPASSLEATAGPNGYGLQIIDDVTGQYQYSTQFGISKGVECNTYVTPSPSSTPYGGGYPVATSTPASSKAASSSASVKPASSSMANSSTVITRTSTRIVLSTGVPAGNSTLVQPTRSMSVPSSLMMSATGSATRSAPAQATTNAAAGLKAGAGLVGAAAALALMF